MTVWGGRDESETIRRLLAEKEQQARFMRSLAEHPEDTWNLVHTLSEWGDQAPTLPAGAIMGLARGGVKPSDPTGRSIIRNGVPAMTPQSSALDKLLASGQYTQTLTRAPEAQIGPRDPNVKYGPDVTPTDIYRGGPIDMGEGGGIGGAIQRGLARIPGQIGEAYEQLNVQSAQNRSFVAPKAEAAATAVQEGVVDPVNRLIFKAGSKASLGTQSPEEVQQAGIFNPRVGKTGARVAGAAAVDASRLVQSLPAVAAAATNQYVRHNPPGSTYKFPFTDATFTVGSISEAISPEQSLLYQHFAKDRSLGEGYLPAGEATEEATRAQQLAGSINGHALTYGRVLAAGVFDPGTVPHSLFSGGVDLLVATKADPSAALLGEYSSSMKTARTFASTSEEAIATTARFLADGADYAQTARLRAWAGRSGDFPILNAVRDGALPERVLDDVNFHTKMRDELSSLSAMDLTPAERETVDLATDYIDEASGEYTIDAPRYGLTADNPDAPRILRELQSLSSRSGTGADLVDSLAAKIRSHPHEVGPIAKELGLDERRLLKAMAAKQAGVFVGLRPFVHRESALSWLSGPGQPVIKHLADTDSFTALRAMFDKTVPVTVLHDIARTSDEAGVRALLSRELGTTVAGPLTRQPSWYRPLADVRLFHQLPHGAFDMTDANQTVDKLEGILRLLKVPKHEWDEYLMPFADPMLDAGTAGDMLFHRVGGLIRDDLIADGAPQKVARKLSRFFKDDYDEQTKFYVNELGETPRVPGFVLDGEPVALEGPFAENELLNRVVPLPDIRGIRQAKTRWRQVTNLWNDGYLSSDMEGVAGVGMRAVQRTAHAEALVSGFINKAFKSIVLASPRVIVTILGDEQARMAAAGLDSAFSGQASFLARVVGHKGDLDAEGIRFRDFWSDPTSEVAQAMGRASLDVGSPYSVDQVFTRGFRLYPKDHEAYVPSWIDNLSKANADLPTREVAKALVDPAYHAGYPVARVGRDASIADATSAPLGAYTSPLDRIKGEFKSPHVVLGGKRNELRDIAHPRNMLDLGPRTHSELIRSIGTTGGTGPETILHLAGESELRRFWTQGFDAQLAELRAKYPHLHLTDSNVNGAIEAIDVYAAQLAKEHGYDAILSRSVRDVASDELVILDPTILASQGATKSGLDGVKEWFWSGNGAVSRTNLANANLKWGSRQLRERAVSDWYIDQLQERVLGITGGDERLMDAVANGTPFDWSKAHRGIGKSVDHDFRHYVARQVDQLGPEQMVGKKVVSKAEKGRVEYAVQRFYHGLMTVPTRKLTRAPAFSQFYWQDIQRLMPRLAPEVQEQMLRVARESKINLTLTAESGELTLETADTIAKARALAFTKDLLDYPGEKTGLEDILRNVVPFGSAFRDALVAWGKLAKANPQVVRRVQQGVLEAQRSGIIGPAEPIGEDQANGDFITIVGAPLMRELTGAFGVDMVGEAKGLNIVSRGLPGFGPGLSMAAAAVLPREPATDAIRKFISPYGSPDISGGFLESFAPGWVEKLRTGGWLQVNGFGLGPTPQQKIEFLDLQKRVTAGLVSSGKYDMSDRDDLVQLTKDSKEATKKLYLWRGLAQAVLPVSPRYEAHVEADDGRMLNQIEAAKVLRRMVDNQEKHGGDYYDGLTEFIDTFGAHTVYGAGVVPMNPALVYGLPTDAAGVIWKNEHADFAEKFPDVYGYWVPQPPEGTKGSIERYFDQVANGERTSPPIDQWIKLIHDQLGNAIYATQRAKLPPSLNQPQRDALARLKVQIHEQLPGYTENILGVPSRADRQQKIEQLIGVGEKPGALDDPAIRNTDLARSARFYLEQRQMLLDYAKRKTLTGTTMAGYRDALYGLGTEITSKYPAFTAMWDNLLSREVEPDA